MFGFNALNRKVWQYSYVQPHSPYLPRKQDWPTQAGGRFIRARWSSYPWEVVRHYLGTGVRGCWVLPSVAKFRSAHREHFHRSCFVLSAMTRGCHAQLMMRYAPRATHRTCRLKVLVVEKTSCIESYRHHPCARLRVSEPGHSYCVAWVIETKKRNFQNVVRRLTSWLLFALSIQLQDKYYR